MAVTSTIEYCQDRDLLDVLPNVSGYDLKARIINWETTGTSNRYRARNSGLVTQLFADGRDLGSSESGENDVTSTHKWYYDSNEDTVYYYNEGSSPNDLMMEAGDDWTNIKQRFRRKASRFVESMLDSRMAREVTKDREGNYPEVIVRVTALKSVMFLLQANDPTSELIDPFKDEFDELIEGLRSGSIVLTTEASGDSSKGIIRAINDSGGLKLIELAGNYSGAGYDLVKVKITGAGVLGTARYSVWTKDSDNLKSNLSVDNEIIDGDFQTLGCGIYARFGGSTDASEATLNNEWEVEVKSIDSRVSAVGSIKMSRS